MTHSVMLVASNDTHVAMYAAVSARLNELDVSCAILSLDPLYRQGATAAAVARGLAVRELESPRGSKGQFYGRPFWTIWRDTVRTVPLVRRLLSDHKVTTVVVANDRGLIEKAILHQARRLGLKTVLVQDGRLAPRPSHSNPVGKIGHTLKIAASAALRALGLPYLAASEYGAGGADLICANGPAGARILEARRSSSSSVVICGQPRYDDLPTRTQTPRWDVLIFTTPFAAAGLGAELQRRQEDLVGRLADWGAEHSIAFAVKPHPREDQRRYSERVGPHRVVAGDARSALAEARLAIAGMSTVVEEAGLIGCPVLVFGSMVHGRAFDSLLPPAHVYPRADQYAELTEMIERYLEPGARSRLLHVQMAHVRDDVHYDAENPAARLVAEAVVG